MDMLTVAKQWVAQGIAVIPLGYRSKFPAADALRLSGDLDENDRATWIRYQTQLPEPETLRRWFCGPRRNLGVVTGWNGLVVIDFDDMTAWETWNLWAEDSCPGVRDSYAVKTGRGVHLYVFVDEPVAGAHAGLIDIKAAGGYVLVPPSIHPSGREYQVLSSSPIVRVSRLSDVLPWSTPEPVFPVATGQTFPVVNPSLCDDPWEAADQPRAASTNGSLVEAILQRVRVEDLLPGAVGQRGRWAKVRCPFHNDNNPSMWVDLQKQLVGCFAGCTDKPLDAIGLYARLHGIGDRDAIHELAQRV